VIITVLSLALSSGVCALSSVWSSELTFATQFCMVSCTILAFILASYGWNMLRVVMNWAVIPLSPKSRLVCLFFSPQAIQIHLDIKAL